VNKEEKEILDKLNKYDFKKGTPVLMEYEIKNMMAYMNRAEQELDKYKNIVDDIDKYIHYYKIEDIGEKTMLILNDILLIKNGMANEVVRLKELKGE